MVLYKQWESVVVPISKKNSDEELAEQKYYKKLQMTTKEVHAQQVFQEYQESFQKVASHVNTKRIQARAFQVLICIALKDAIVI